jgi:hypothetical protein
MLVKSDDGFYQIVKKSNGTVYIKRYSGPGSSPAQMAVRGKLATASIQNYGKNREDIVEAVRRSVFPVKEGDILNETEKSLLKRYPEVVEIVRKMKPVKASKPLIEVVEKNAENSPQP